MSNNTMELVNKYKVFIQYGVFLVVAMIVYNAWNSYDLVFVPAENTQMSPTFEPNSFRLGHRLTEMDSLEYGDIVYYEFPHEKTLSRKEHLFFGRIVGKPGDVLEMKKGVLYRNQQKVEESYVALDKKGEFSFISVHIPQKRYFVLNDSRARTSQEIFMRDSRFWGPIHRTSMIGKISE